MLGKHCLMARVKLLEELHSSEIANTTIRFRFSLLNANTHRIMASTSFIGSSLTRGKVLVFLYNSLRNVSWQGTYLENRKLTVCVSKLCSLYCGSNLQDKNTHVLKTLIVYNLSCFK